MTTLSPTQRKALKARAHSLKPVVVLGGKGLTDPVVAEVERALAAHELVKVRVAEMDWDGRDAVMGVLVERCGAHPVQHIGKVLVLYREKPPEAKRAATPKTAPSGSRPIRSERPGSRSASRRPGSARPPSRPRTSRSGRGRSGS
ncbi:MAG: ribosome assembly RNA-binding protein YhbY [Betaproteobacteria bacterium]|nr:ribosome assembly RNA-binding protein YhbY [Betaproteobacteria bacterium]